MWRHMASSEKLVNISLVNGFLPDGNSAYTWTNDDL